MTQQNAGLPGSIANREDFMRHVASRLGRRDPLAVPPARPVIGVPEFYAEREFSYEEKRDAFIRNWTALTGRAYVVQKDNAVEGILEVLASLIEEFGIQSITRWEHEALQALGLDDWLKTKGVDVVPWAEDGAVDKLLADSPLGPESKWAQRSPLLRSAERCQLGIVYPDYAIANTSTLVLSAEGGRGRSVSLLPSMLFAIIPAERLVTRMGQALSELREQYPEESLIPSSINLITGPSRSSDIENDLTVGIHGPGKVFAVIVE